MSSEKRIYNKWRGTPRKSRRKGMGSADYRRMVAPAPHLSRYLKKTNYMIKLYSPSSPAESALLQSILEEEGIPFFIHNDTFGSMEVGPQIDIYNMKTIMIEEMDKERARELLQDFFKTTRQETRAVSTYSFFDKIRMALEVLLFGWFMPGRRRKRSNGGESET